MEIEPGNPVIDMMAEVIKEVDYDLYKWIFVNGDPEDMEDTQNRLIGIFEKYFEEVEDEETNIT